MRNMLSFVKISVKILSINAKKPSYIKNFVPLHHVLPQAYVRVYANDAERSQNKNKKKER